MRFSTRLRVLYLIFILAILGAVIAALFLQHGGQRSIPLIATSLLEVNGVATYLNTNGSLEVWDASDVSPTSLENGATFLTTSFLRWKQQRGNCSGLIPCASDPDCQSAYDPVNAGGVQTGTCLPSGYCEVQAWCPLENPNSGTPPFELDGVLDFSLFVRAFVGIPSTNDGFDTGTEKIRNWNYFALSDLLKNASLDFEQVRTTGAVLALSYDYDCEIDFNTADKCKTKAKTRVIALGKGKTPETSSGFSIYKQDRFERYNATADKYYIVRQLNKLYGVRVVVLVTGIARKWDFKSMITNVGAALGNISLATLLVELLMNLPLEKIGLGMLWSTVVIDKYCTDDKMLEEHKKAKEVELNP